MSLHCLSQYIVLASEVLTTVLVLVQVPVQYRAELRWAQETQSVAARSLTKSEFRQNSAALREVGDAVVILVNL
jgi:hypothetical protein